MQSSELLLPLGMAFAAVFLLVIWVGFAIVRVQKTPQDRLAMYGRKPTTREETLEQPFAERALAPVVLAFGKLLNRFTPAGYLEKVQTKLTHAGNPGGLDAASFVTLKAITTVLFIGLAWFVRGQTQGSTQLLAFFGTMLIGFLGPDAILTRKVQERALTMLRSLPDTLDLLVISVEAGLGFDSALQRVVTTVPGPLSEEFFRMLQETRVGVSRRDAMRHLMERTDLEELRSFLLAMMQAEAFGVTIARVLRVQADEMRVKRRQRAQEKAFAAPVKIVFPLVFCIFPALFIVLLGPAGIKISETFSTM